MQPFADFLRSAVGSLFFSSCFSFLASMIFTFICASASFLLLAALFERILLRLLRLPISGHAVKIWFSRQTQSVKERLVFSPGGPDDFSLWVGGFSGFVGLSHRYREQSAGGSGRRIYRAPHTLHNQTGLCRSALGLPRLRVSSLHATKIIRSFPLPPGHRDDTLTPDCTPGALVLGGRGTPTARPLLPIDPWPVESYDSYGSEYFLFGLPNSAGREICFIHVLDG